MHDSPKSSCGRRCRRTFASLCIVSLSFSPTSLLLPQSIAILSFLFFLISLSPVSVIPRLIDLVLCVLLLSHPFLLSCLSSFFHSFSLDVFPFLVSIVSFYSLLYDLSFKLFRTNFQRVLHLWVRDTTSLTFCVRDAAVVRSTHKRRPVLLVATQLPR